MLLFKAIKAKLKKRKAKTEAVHLLFDDSVYIPDSCDVCKHRGTCDRTLNTCTVVLNWTSDFVCQDIMFKLIKKGGADENKEA